MCNIRESLDVITPSNSVMLRLLTIGIDSGFQACISEAAYNATLKQVEIRDSKTIEDLLSDTEAEKMGCQLVAIDLRNLDFDVPQTLFVNSTALIIGTASQVEKYEEFANGGSLIKVPEYSDRNDLIRFLEFEIKNVIDKYREAVNRHIRELCDLQYSELKSGRHFASAFFALANKHIRANAITMGFLFSPDNTFEKIFTIGNSLLEISRGVITEHKTGTPHMINIEHRGNIIGSNTALGSDNQSVVVCSYIDSRSNRNYVVYEFESNLPTGTLEDICNCSTREFYRLYKEIAAIKRSKVIRNLISAQHTLPDEEKFYRLVCGEIRQFFSADGVSILLVAAIDGNQITFEKIYAHHSRYEKILLQNVTYGYAHHCVSKNSSLIIEETITPNEPGDGIGIGKTFKTKRSFGDEGELIRLKYFFAPNTIEDEASLIYAPFYDPGKGDEMMGLIKVGNFKVPRAFSIHDIRDLELIGEVLAPLLYSLRVIQKLKLKEDITYRSNKLMSQAETLYFWREIALGAFHSIANLLAGIDGTLILAETLSHKYDDPELKEKIASARAIMRNSKEILKVTKERGSELRPIIQKTKLIEEVLNPAIDRTNKTLAYSSWKITHTYQNKEYFVEIDGSLTRESIINMLNNAVSAVKRNTTVGKKIVRVIVREIEKGKTVKIEIRDNGVGIDSEFQKNRLFKPFETTKAQGTGLGLYFTKRILNEFGGDVRLLRSYPGKGTTFLIELPLSATIRRS